MMIILIGIIVLRVVPAFSDFYANFDRGLPLSTRIVVAVSNGVVSNIGFIVVGVVGLAVAAMVWSRQPAQRHRLDRWVLDLPWVGETARKFFTSQLARMLATLLGGGIPLVNALEISVRSLSNQHLARELDRVRVRVQEGQGFAAALRERNIFPDVAVKMVEVGESTGALQEMLNSLAEFYDEEIETEVGRFITLGGASSARVHGDRHCDRRAGSVYAAVRIELRGRRVMATAKTNPLPDSDDFSEEVARARALAVRYRLEFVEMSEFRIDQDLFRSIPADLMLRYGFVPHRREGRSLVIVVSDPTDLPMIDELGVILRTPIRVTVGAPSAIQAILKKSESSQRVLEEATEGFELQVLKEDETGEENLTVERLTSDISPIIKLVDSTIYTAIQRRASDIHIETGDDAVYVKYRIDGVLQPAMRPIGKQFHSSIISRVKVMAELDIAEKRVPQDGRFKVRMPGKTIDFRVSIMPSVHGEDAVIRILDKESISEQFTELKLDILGLPELELRRFRKYIREPYGMVLVTGPTGSGKTTTLYAALSEIKSVEDKIVTIEDPVEYQLRGITQIPINEKKGLTFARGLRSILRHDPDKIMVGEIRDPETAQIAIQSALTGHLVFTTVHANNVVDVLGRFLNMGVEPYQFVSALNCVMAQRLVRLICSHCKRPKLVDAKALQEAGLSPELAQTHRFYEGTGCVECGGTGFKGRTAICELLNLSDRIREMILDRRPASEVKKAAHEDGMRFLRESAIEKVLTGLTTLREINKVTFVE